MDNTITLFILGPPGSHFKGGLEILTGFGVDFLPFQPIPWNGYAAHPFYKGQEKLEALQRKILIRGFDLLKPGGEMLYSTCTYTPQENEAVVHCLLQERPATLRPIQLGADVEPGVLTWNHKRYDQRLERAARFYPHRINSVGFFLARIVRR